MSARRAIIVDDTDSRIQYIGSSWFQDQGSQDNAGNFGPAYQSTLHGTRSDASLSFSFNGTKVSVYGSNNLRNDSGVLDPTWECFIDNISIGKTAPFQFAENNWLFCDQDGLLDGPHILTVNATVKKQQPFWFDNIQYIPSSSLSLDNAAVMVDSLDSELQYGSGWNALGTTANFTQSPNAIFTYSFIGVSLSWYSFIPAEFPHTATFASYSVDNQVPVQFSLKGLPAGTTTTIYNQKFFQTSDYPMGSHKIVVTYLGSSSTTPLTLDYLVVQNGTSPSPSGASSSPTTSGNAGSAGSSHSSNVGAIAGGVVGGIVLIILATLAIIYFRRWDRKQSTKPLYNHKEHDTGDVIDPFQLAPSIQPAPTTYSQYSPLPTAAGGKTQHRTIPSQTTTDLNSIEPPSSASGGIVPPTASSRDIPSSFSRSEDTGHLSTPTNEVHAGNSLHQDSSRLAQPLYQGMSEKERREAEATAAALRPQQHAAQQIVTSPQSASSGTGSSRLIMHEDSGIRLPRPTSEGVVEVPPTYTVD
ncbi:hypothetical protein JR316_0004003 [Psilocybe cubensis]|uniref:Uncharacterized protein n=2 Tax=Psilocybe cubensis TaxID=181762 RepID=A0ACB8H9C2_PSICU|nr:hypothetical protein JR316_0004003 [Psilocybe cubensis]KAH9484521.1 hypothetical protein JR316_0004003 [Psilocybe cubensis]